MEGGPVGLILKGCHPMTIPAKFDLVWFSGIRREYLNVKKFKIYDKRHPSFGKRSHCRGELKKKKKKKAKECRYDNLM